ncbi:MAG: hypothetical protein WAM97_08690 [Acidimicrobiales bacterium]
MVGRRVGPIAAVKALREVTGKRVNELKVIVDAALPPDVRAGNERFRDEAETALFDTNDQNPHPTSERKK